MAKDKTKPKVKGIPNRHLHSRVSFLYQAASYLAAQGVSNHGAAEAQGSSKALTTNSKGQEEEDPIKADEEATKDLGLLRSRPTGHSLQLVFQLRAVSRKAQIRLTRDVKRSICKNCNALLDPGKSSLVEVENLSRGGKKTWADVLVIKCLTCGEKKRYPIGSNRQLRKSERASPLIRT